MLEKDASQPAATQHQADAPQPGFLENSSFLRLGLV